MTNLVTRKSRAFWQALKGTAACARDLRADYNAQRLWADGMQRIVNEHYERKRSASGQAQEPTDPGGDG